ncbi:MAG TPA: hypothetical protein VH228_17745 [Nocardioides sp.]|nr:hypothetical protein [Nocardioides sp.]
MKPAVARPIVALALVAAAWSQAPAAHAARGGNGKQTEAHGRSGIKTDGGGRMTVFHSVETDLHTGQVSVREFVREFDSVGNEIHERLTQTEGGVLTEYEDTAFTYGEAHRLGKVVTVSDQDGDGPEPASVRVDTLTRNNRHELTSIVTTIDEDGDGTIDNTSTESRGFDKRGRVISSRVEDGGIVTVESITYDSHGNVLSHQLDTDDESTPQSPDQRETTTSSYDGRGLLQQTTDASFAFDSTGTATLLQSNTTTLTWNHQDQITEEQERGDLDGDGQIDFTGDTTATYDTHGLLVSSVGLFTDPSGSFSSTQVYTRDKAGNAVRVVSEEMSNGVLLDRIVETATFDKFGRPTTTVEERDLDGDGDLDAADAIETFNDTYDNKGRTIASTDRITDGTGVLLYFEKDTASYGKNTETRTRDIDDDGDGVFDRHVEEMAPLLVF